MKKIDVIDENFKIGAKLDEKTIKFCNVKERPFDLYGFYSAKKGEKFTRLPESVAKKINEGVASLYAHTAGGRVRFKTNSPYVAISVKYPTITYLPHMPFTGTAGFDMYLFADEKYKYVKTFVPPYDITTDGYESIHYFQDNEWKDIIINFPPYNEVSELYVGIAEDCELCSGGKYVHKKPIVYYGSSITQGACASRPGNTYQAVVSRGLNCDYINLGFSGSAKGEASMAEYISNLEMSCFVYDYDYNAPTPEYLAKTHKPMFDIIRQKNPDLPIIMMSAPLRTDIDEETVRARAEIIRSTYHEAVSNGDKNVYFIEGKNIFDIFGGDSGTVDGTHPTDLGFMCMAECLMKELKKALKL